MHLTHNECESVVAVRFIRTLKDLIYKKMAVIDSKSYLGYLSNLVDRYNNTYHHSIGKKPIDTDYSALSGEIEMNPKAPECKVDDRVRITLYKNIFSKGYTENWSKEIFVIDSMMKTNLWVYKIKDLNEEKMISFYEKNCCRVNHK